jgi:uncharacterized membrane protein
MENASSNVQFDPSATPPALPPPVVEDVDSIDKQEMTQEQRNGLIIAIVIFVVLLLFTVGGIYFLLQPTTNTAKIRDVFIIFMAIQSLLTGLTLVVLMVQLSRLINLLNNEIKPILDSTNTTISSLRGTTIFLRDNLVEPVIKLNEYFAGFSQLMTVVGLGRKARRGSSK